MLIKHWNSPKRAVSNKMHDANKYRQSPKCAVRMQLTVWLIFCQFPSLPRQLSNSLTLWVIQTSGQLDANVLVTHVWVDSNAAAEQVDILSVTLRYYDSTAMFTIQSESL